MTDFLKLLSHPDCTEGRNLDLQENESFQNYDLQYFKGVLLLFFVAMIWTIYMTFLPVVVTIPPTDYYLKYNGWYTGNDVLRFLEPIGGSLLHFSIILASGIFKSDLSTRNSCEKLCVFTFMFGIALYVQGAAFHSASNMFKNDLESVMQIHDDAVIKDLHFWMRTVWEHQISHYIYACGFSIILACEAWAYRNHSIQPSILDGWTKGYIVATSVAYAVLITGVAADFPSGIVVCLVYLCVYGLGIIGGYIIWQYTHGDNQAMIFGCRPVLHMFSLSYVLAIFLVLMWVAVVGGIKTRAQAMG